MGQRTIVAKEAEALADSIHILLRVFTVNERLFPPAEGRTKYNGIDFQTLGYLSRNPGCRPKDLATYLGVAPTTVQSAIDRLIRRGLVDRTPSPNSGRDVALSLTPDGKALRAAIRRQDLSNCATMLSAVPKSERTRFLKNIQRVADTLSDHEQSYHSMRTP